MVIVVFLCNGQLHELISEILCFKSEIVSRMFSRSSFEDFSLRI